MALIAAVPGMAGAETLQEQSTASVSSAGIRSVTVENARGLVSVTRSATPEIRVTALKVVRSTDAKWAQRVAAETRVITDRRGGEYVVRAVYPQRQAIQVHFLDLFKDFELPRVEVRLAVEVPDGTALRLESTSGDIASAGVRSAQVVQSTSGDVTVAGASQLQASSTSGDLSVSDVGAGELRTVSGDLAAERLAGAFKISTTSGDLKVSGAGGPLELSSVSGDITVDAAPRGVSVKTTSGGVDVRRAAGAIRVQSTSGDVKLGVLNPFQRADVVTVNGGVDLRFAPDASCALDLASSSGEIQVQDLPLDMKQVTHHKLEAVVRHGGTPVVIRTSSGDISLSEGAR
jgi:hypothetical protein